MLSVLQLSERRYALVEISTGGRCNLKIYSKGRTGDFEEMIEVPKSKLLTKKLDHETAMLLFCLLSRRVELSEEEWDYILPNVADEVARYYQPRW